MCKFVSLNLYFVRSLNFALKRYKISDILRDSREHQQNTLHNEMERIKKSQALNIPKHSLEVRLKRRLSKNYSQVRKTSDSETPNPMKAFRSLNTQKSNN